MEYDRGIALSNIHNIAVVLCRGGMWSCRDISRILWDDSTSIQKIAKIRAHRDPNKRTFIHSREQLCKEVRRSLHDRLNTHFGSSIHSAKAYLDNERFWVVSECSENPEDIHNEQICEFHRVLTDILTNVVNNNTGDTNVCN